jgi:hypothetical protein
VPPTVLDALRLGGRAVTRRGWLAAVGLVVALARAALLLPAQLFALVVLRIAASRSLGGAPLPLPGAAAEGALAVATAPRFLAITAGLWAAGALLAAALRVAWLAGALPTLGGELAGAPRRRVFAAGLARGFATLLPAAALGFALELVAALAGAGAVLGAVLAGDGAARPLLAAALGAGALTAAAVAIAAAGALADATLARAALRGEGPARALARAAGRFARRPAAFLAVALAAVVADLVLGWSAKALAALGAGAGAAGALVLLGPQLMAWTLGVLAAAAVELWRLAATAVLACHAAPEDLSAAGAAATGAARSSAAAAPAPTA